MLLLAKRGESGSRQQLAAYLLATLGHDYLRNRDELLHVWHGCVVNDFDHGCDDETGMLLIHLYEQGHWELLRSLLAGSRHSDGALSEELGDFYGEYLGRRPQDFVAALATFPSADQKAICELAGSGDGGGMEPRLEARVLVNLKQIGGPVASRCAKGVRVGNNDADDSQHDLPDASPAAR